MDIDDPYDWTTDRVVQELCTPNRSWQPYTPSMKGPDPIPLEKALREQEVNGATLLLDIDDNAMKHDLGILIFGRRAFIRSAIADLRVRSAKYAQYVVTHRPGSAEASHYSLSLRDLAGRYSPTVEPLKLPQPGATAPLGIRSLDGDQELDTSGTKRRKLVGAESTNTEISQPIAGDIQEVPLSNTNSAYADPVSDAHFDRNMSADVNSKKRKRIAPTLITPEIDPNRNRQLITAADDVIEHSLNTIERVIPGKPYIGDDGKKRMVPIQESGFDITETLEYAPSTHTTSQDLKPRSTSQILQSAHSSTSKLKPSSNSQAVGDSLSQGYLGKRRMSVDDIFYHGTKVGQELVSTGGDEEFYFTSTISNGRRLYVNSMMRHFLRSERKVFERRGQVFTALLPYKPGFIPRFSKPSFTLFSTTSEGKIHASRHEVPSWPEIDSEAKTRMPLTTVGDDTVVFNSVHPDKLNALESHEDWNPSFLEKYKSLEGGDTILPLYGDSDEENEYDEETWREIEEEQGHLLDRPERKLRKQPMEDDEVIAAIDRGIAIQVSKWNEKKLPNLKRRAFRLWHNSRKLNSWKLDIESARQKLSHIEERIIGLRSEIMSEVWTSETQVLKQVSILEPSVFDRQTFLWTKTLLEQRKPPIKLTQESPTKSKISSVSCELGEDDGELLDTDESSDGELSDFIVSDHLMDSGDEHEPDLADGEEGSDDDETMSDSSENEPQPVTPIRPARDTPNAILESHSPSLVKNEEPILPKHRPGVKSDPTVNMIDLTVLSSDSEPRVVSLITPKKPKVRVKLNTHKSTQHSLILLDTDHFPDPNNLPALNRPGDVSKYASQVWENLRDRERLLISVLCNMDSAIRGRIVDFVSAVYESDLWLHMTQIMEACRQSRQEVKGMDAHIYETLNFCVRLFQIYVDCQNHSYRASPTKNEIMRIEENHEEYFTPFYKLLQKVPGYFARKQSAKSSPLCVPKCTLATGMASDEELEIVSVLRRRHSEAFSSSEEENPVEDTPRKKRPRKVFEDVNARILREQDRQRLAEQEERRKNLHKSLALDRQFNHDKIIVNDAKSDDQGYIYINSHISGSIKKHQIAGVRFMWNQIVANGGAMQGCLLAHTMGLGKTMQVITLLVAIAEASISNDPSIWTQVPETLRKSRTLVLCPPGLVGNWMDELLMWGSAELLGNFRAVVSSDRLDGRLRTIAMWYEEGGVLVIGYDMLRNIIQNKGMKGKPPPLDEEQYERVVKQLLDGPTIIIADEAHKLKNAKASVTTVADRFRSSSRIALTGSPLANNVEEYHTMIDWVAPNYLGPAKEFRAKYVEPIQDGLWRDSSSFQRRKSLKMLGVLKEDIAPKVNRADMSVLRHDLPPKKEFVIKVSLTEMQRKAYTIYVKSMLSQTGHARTKDGKVKQSTIWHWLTILALLCNHPDCFNEKLRERKGDAKKEAAKAAVMSGPFDITDSGEEVTAVDAMSQKIAEDLNEPVWKIGVSQQLIREETSLFDAEGVDIKAIELSNKVKILCQILDASRTAGDKVLVFSQSIPTLNFLQDLFEKQHRKYNLLTGKTKMSNRQVLTKKFNDGDEEVYLISTTAGGLGLNLPGANRVVIFDFKFNPIMEEQAVGRAYRIGQKKETFVYRFVSAGTFEDTVHNKTIFKMQLSSRVVDNKNPIAHAKKHISEFLFEPKHTEQENLVKFLGRDPKVLDHILASQNDVSTIRAIVETEMFELDDDDKLTAEEEKEVKQLLSDEQLKRSNPEKYQQMMAQRATTNQQPQTSNTSPPLAMNQQREAHAKHMELLRQSNPKEYQTILDDRNARLARSTPEAHNRPPVSTSKPALQQKPLQTTSRVDELVYITDGASKLPGSAPNAPQTRPAASAASKGAPSKPSPATDSLKDQVMPPILPLSKDMPLPRVPARMLSERSAKENATTLAPTKISDNMPPLHDAPQSTKSTTNMSASPSSIPRKRSSVLPYVEASESPQVTRKLISTAKENSLNRSANINRRVTISSESAPTASAQKITPNVLEPQSKSHIFNTTNRRPVSSLKTPVTKSTGTSRFHRSLVDDDAKEMQLIAERRQARSGVRRTPSRLPGWAQKDIDDANSSSANRRSRASSGTASPRPTRPR